MSSLSKKGTAVLKTCSHRPDFSSSNIFCWYSSDSPHLKLKQRRPPVKNNNGFSQETLEPSLSQSCKCNANSRLTQSFIQEVLRILTKGDSAPKDALFLRLKPLSFKTRYELLQESLKQSLSQYHETRSPLSNKIYIALMLFLKA